MLLIKGAKTMFNIVFTMINIVATIIYIVFTKIGSILKRLKCHTKGNKVTLRLALKAQEALL